MYNLPLPSSENIRILHNANASSQTFSSNITNIKKDYQYTKITVNIKTLK